MLPGQARVIVTPPIVSPQSPLFLPSFCLPSLPCRWKLSNSFGIVVSFDQKALSGSYICSTKNGRDHDITDHGSGYAPPATLSIREPTNWVLFFLSHKTNSIFVNEFWNPESSNPGSENFFCLGRRPSKVASILTLRNPQTRTFKRFDDWSSGQQQHPYCLFAAGNEPSSYRHGLGVRPGWGG